MKSIVNGVKQTELTHNDDKAYMGNQLECEFGGTRCFRILADMDFIMVCKYEKMAKIRNYLFIKRDDENWSGRKIIL